MARPYTLPMSVWVNFANYVVESSVERMQEATERIQKRTYSPSDLLADSVGFWMDGADAWWSSFQQTVAGPVPFAFIRMRPDEEAASCEMPILKVDRGALRATDLVKLGGGAARKSPWVTAAWDKSRANCAVIEAHGLDHDRLQVGERLEKGLYQSSVHLDEKLVAIVQVLVED